MLTILLTRHGHTARSEPEQYLGQHIDIPLSQRGRSDAHRLADRLAPIAFERVICSPLLRARETAEIVGPSHLVETDARLMEADYGAWEGLTTEVVESRWPDLRVAWEADPARLGPPEGEHGNDIARRARSFLRSITAWEAQVATGDGDRGDRDRRVLVIGHSTFNRVLLAVALGVAVRDYRRRFRQDWLNVTVLRPGIDGRALLLLANDTSHLIDDRARPWW